MRKNLPLFGVSSSSPFFLPFFLPPDARLRASPSSLLTECQYLRIPLQFGNYPGVLTTSGKKAYSIDDGISYL